MGKVIRAYRQHPYHGRRGLTQDDIAAWAGITQGQVSTVESPTSPPTNRLDRLISWAQLLGIPEQYLWFKLPEPDVDGPTTVEPSPPSSSDPATALDDADAWELASRVEASDVGPATIDALELATDELCRSYTNTSPAALLGELSSYRRHITRLLDGRASLTQRRSLVVLGGWLSLLAACVHVDLGHRRAAVTNREIARGLGVEAGHPELIAWAFEVTAWQAILAGRHPEAAELCRAGRDLVAEDTSAHVQLSVQEARALARMGLSAEVHAILDRSSAAVDRMGTPTQPDHHFVFDPRKHVGYTATTLAWLGDTEHGEHWARRAVDQYHDDTQHGRSARRLATARIDLALILTAAEEPDEAAHLGALALGSGRLVPSNIWRATELNNALRPYRDLPDIDAFHVQYIDTYQHVTGHGPGSDK